VIPTPEGHEGAVSVHLNELEYEDQNAPEKHVEEAAPAFNQNEQSTIPY